MRLFDSHAHLDIHRKSLPGSSIDQTLARARSAGLVGMVVVAGAMSPGEYARTLDILDAHDWIWGSAGIHPHGAAQSSPQHFEALSSALSHPRMVALGEIGLDYHYDTSPRPQQRAVFEKQLEIANEIHKPVVVHTREADSDTVDILRNGRADRIGGVIHCFTAGAELAQSALDMGFYISFSGIITFPNAAPIREVARWIPTDRILVETDAPFLSPVPFRGQPNEPARVLQVVEKISEIRGMSVEEAARLTLENAVRCFSIPMDT